MHPWGLLILLLISSDLISSEDCFQWEQTSGDMGLEQGVGQSVWADRNGVHLWTFGGCTKDDPATCSTQLIRYDLDTQKWDKADINRVDGDSIPRMIGQASVYDPNSDTVFIFGGRRTTDSSAIEYSNSLDLIFREPETNTWKWLSAAVSGFPIPPLSDCTMTLVGSTLVVFGGVTSNGTLSNEVYFMSTSGPLAFEWAKPTIIGNPPLQRKGHSATLVGSRIYIYGGTTDSTALGDVYTLTVPLVYSSTTAGTASTTSTPSTGSGDLLETSSTSVPSRKLLESQTAAAVGGKKSLDTPSATTATDATETGGDCCEEDDGSKWRWHAVSPRFDSSDNDNSALAPSPAPRALHVAQLAESQHSTNQQIIIVGGVNPFDSSVQYDDVVVLDVVNNVWTKAPQSLNHQLQVESEWRESGIAFANRRPASGVRLASCVSTDMTKLFVVGGSTALYKLDFDGVCAFSCVHGTFVEEFIDLQTNLYYPSSCACQKGYAGRMCSFESPCPKLCSGPTQGSCVNGGGSYYCACINGYWGSDCSNAPCPNSCSGHGVCMPTRNSVNYDQTGQSIPSSSLGSNGDNNNSSLLHTVTPLKSSSQTTSDSNKQDESKSGFLRVDEEGDVLLEQTSKSKSRVSIMTAASFNPSSWCACADGYSGESCNVLSVSATSGSSGSGSSGSSGSAGSPGSGSSGGAVDMVCPANCSGHGLCKLAGSTAVCKCAAGFGGADCSVQCPDLCSQQGTCNEVGVCLCNDGFTGLSCSESACHYNCSNRGVCVGLKCYCDDGFTGQYCQLDTTCGGHGDWISGPAGQINSAGVTAGGLTPFCRCHAGYTASDCSIQLRCDSDCSGRGYCGPPPPLTASSPAVLFTPYSPSPSSLLQLQVRSSAAIRLTKDAALRSFGSQEAQQQQTQPLYQGQCVCNAGFGGSGCETRQCPNSCVSPSHGTCDSMSGICYCWPGYAGSDCSLVVDCPQNCTSSSHGKCVVSGGGVNGGNGGSLLFVSSSIRSSLNCYVADGAAALSDVDTGALTAVERDAFIQQIASCSNIPTSQIYQRKAYSSRKQKNGALLEVGRGRGSFSSVMAVGGGQCVCTAGYRGADCSQLRCPNDCSNNGACSSGLCTCYPGYQGNDCSTAIPCPRNSAQIECSDRGVCHRASGKCFCAPGFGGDACEQDTNTCGAGAGCSGHGVCQYGQCFCDVGYAGQHCENVPTCGDNCNGRGFCLNNTCHCFTGFKGQTCEQVTVDLSCPNQCSGSGVCQHGRCFCVDGYSGPDCSTIVGFCENNNCSDHGICRFGRCFCEPDYSGALCSSGGCVGGCTVGRGMCVLGECRCFPGFTASDCSQEIECPGSTVRDSTYLSVCSGHGVCLLGKCACEPGWSGADCATLAESVVAQMCRSNCSNHGLCFEGRCVCVPGYAGEECQAELEDAANCPMRCSGSPPLYDDRGVCHHGKCYCKPGFSGDACQDELKCSPDCTKNGICAYGQCFCVAGYTGADCQTPLTDFEEMKRLLYQDDFMTWIRRGGRVEDEAAFLAFLQKQSSIATPASRRLLSASPSTSPNELQKSNPKLSLSGTDITVLADAHSRTHSHSSNNFSSPCADLNGCSFHGVCVDNRCYCDTSFSGEDCSIVGGGALTHRCPQNCSARGECLFGKCFCYPGFSGLACQNALTLPCPSDCSGHGVCHLGQCFCDFGFKGRKCNIELTCGLRCGSHGVCLQGRCICARGFAGTFCNIAVERQEKLDPEDYLIFGFLEKPHKDGEISSSESPSVQELDSATTKDSSTISKDTAPIPGAVATQAPKLGAAPKTVPDNTVFLDETIPITQEDTLPTALIVIVSFSCGVIAALACFCAWESRSHRKHHHELKPLLDVRL